MPSVTPNNLVLPSDASGKSILLAVSGGIDSMCMAELFHRGGLCRRFAIATVNFHLRGEEAEADRDLVRQWAEVRGIEFFTTDFDTRRYVSEKGVSIEMAARELRYGWFAQLMEQQGFDYLATAHHLGDSAETMVLNLLRGTGLRGIGGIKAFSDSLIRPMIGFTRTEIEDFVRKECVPFREDATNAESDFARNRIRNEVFPQFAKINPSFLRVMERDMAHFSEATEVIDEMLQTKRKTLCREGQGVMTIDTKALAAEKHAAFWLYMLLEPFGFNASQVDDIMSGLDSQSGRKFTSDDWILVGGRGCLTLYGSDAAACRDISVNVFDIPEDFTPVPPAGVLYVDADLIELPLEVRPWEAGDRFRPFGMTSGRLVSDFFSDLKLDIVQKMQCPVVLSRGQIVCVAPLRIDDRYRITAITRRVAAISLAPQSLSSVDCRANGGFVFTVK